MRADKATDKTADRTYPNLGKVVIASRVIAPGENPRRTRNIILLLAASVALMMTGFGIVMPVFARRLGEFGSGVEALGLMTVSFALAQLVAAPVMGTLADRLGRRPLVLVGLVAFTIANIGYLLAPSTAAFIVIRGLAGAFTAGIFPAAMGIVADIVPENERARWIGIVMGGYGVGFIFGPVMGGILYDGWGFAAPFIASATMGFIAFVTALILVPETRPLEVRRREKLRQRRAAAIVSAPEGPFWASLPKPLYIFGSLLFLDFIGNFAFAFIEPEMVFYFYDELGWTTTQFGLVVGAYGLAMVLGQTTLGQASDRFGRKPIIILGLLLNITLYFGLAIVSSFSVMSLIAITSGLGGALIAPALSAFYLDITQEQHRSRVVGIKESALSLGGVAGPLLVVVVSPLTTPQGIFIIAGMLMVMGMVLALIVLREPEHAAKDTIDTTWEISNRRSMVAQASLRGIVLRAKTRRAKRVVA
jgi:multidrug resistance protein